MKIILLKPTISSKGEVISLQIEPEYWIMTMAAGGTICLTVFTSLLAAISTAFCVPYFTKSGNEDEFNYKDIYHNLNRPCKTVEWNCCKFWTKNLIYTLVTVTNVVFDLIYFVNVPLFNSNM